MGEALGREPDGALVRELEARHAEAAQMRMYGMMLRRDRPAATIYGEYELVRGMAGLLEEAGIPAVNQLSAHSLHALPEHDPAVRHLPVEKERIELMRGLRRQLVLAGEVSHTLLDADNTFVCVSLPLVNGAQVATHMPLAGPRGADYMLEHIGAYLDTLS